MALKQEKLLDQAIFMGHGSHKNSVCGQAGLVLFSVLCFVGRREYIEPRPRGPRSNEWAVTRACLPDQQNAWRCRLDAATRKCLGGWDVLMVVLVVVLRF